MLLQALCIIWSPLASSNWSDNPETPNLGQNRRFCLAVWPLDLMDDLEKQWGTSSEQHEALCIIYHHMSILTEITVREWLSRVLTSVTLTFDPWPWPFARTLLWSLAITPKNFMMIRWGEHRCERRRDGRTDRQTDGRIDGQRQNTIYRAAWSQLKMRLIVGSLWAFAVTIFVVDRWSNQNRVYVAIRLSERYS